MPHALLADAVLVVHFGVVVFVVGGLLAIGVGNLRGWRWVNGRGFRWAHLAAIGVIVVQAWLGQHCPLTVLEMWLRGEAGQPVRYDVSFIQYWLHRVMYFDAPLWVFAIIYTGFAALVAAAWWCFPPEPRRGAGESQRSN
jgi:hypothetical protein